MTELGLDDCTEISGGAFFERLAWTAFSILATRAYNALDAALASPGSQFESSPFLDAVAAGNQTA